MTATLPMPTQAAIAVNDMLDNCACIQPDQHVLILSASDGLYGGTNIVDETAVAWIQAGVQARGAHATVMWVDMPVRPAVIWPPFDTTETVWKIPPIVKGAMKSADILISHIFDLSSEEHLKEMPALLKELKLPMVRNMATTAPLLCSAWARTPHDVVAEIRYRTAEMIKPGERFVLTHPNGTHVEGTVGVPGRGGDQYAYWRKNGYYRPFPDGIYPAVEPEDAEGVYIFDRMMPIWARNIGVPPKFSEPVRMTIEKSRIIKLDGGAEAKILSDFLVELAKVLGEENAYAVRAPHGGVHPSALISAAQCPDEDYREFIASFHPSSLHLHMGRGGETKSFPYNLHTSLELRGATLTIGNQVVHDNGRLGVEEHPDVQAMVARYPDRPGLDGARWHVGDLN
jgi:hypothetical protein